MGLEDGKYWVVTVPVRQRVFQSSPPSVCVTPAPAHGAGRRPGWCPPRQVEQGVDLAVGPVALVEHTALIPETSRCNPGPSHAGPPLPWSKLRGLLLPCDGLPSWQGGCQARKTRLALGQRRKEPPKVPGPQLKFSYCSKLN